jgi:hypothetical protein
MTFTGVPEELLTIPTARDTGAPASFAMNEPVLGYRAWLVRPSCDGYQLRSILVPMRWAAEPGAWTCARCRPGAAGGPVPQDSTAMPHPDCPCGLYAYHSLAAGGYDERMVREDGGDLGIVWGAVAGAGRVLVYRDGWRAQFARPVAIVDGSGSRRDVLGVAGQLGIPVVSSSGVARVAAEFGRPWEPNPASPTPARLVV